MMKQGTAPETEGYKGYTPEGDQRIQELQARVDSVIIADQLPSEITRPIIKGLKPATTKSAGQQTIIDAYESTITSINEALKTEALSRSSEISTLRKIGEAMETDFPEQPLVKILKDLENQTSDL